MIVKSILNCIITYTFFEVITLYYKRLRELREDSDKTQKIIALFLGIDQRVYSNYETGKRDIPIQFLISLARYYNVSVDYILELTDDRDPYNKPNTD